MNILVTGGAGYIGSVLCRQLLDRGHRVLCYDRLDHGIQPIRELMRNRRFQLIEADIRSVDILRFAIHQCDAIIHLASIVGAPAVAKNPTEAEDVNVNGANLVNELRSPDQPLLFSSTGSVYGRVEGVCTEATPVAPLSDYGRQKALAENIFLDKGHCVIYRFATAFGTSPRLRLDLLPNDFVWKALHEGRIEMYEGMAKRTFLHVQDIGRAFLHALDQFDAMSHHPFPVGAGPIFNAGDETLNWHKHRLASAIRERVAFDLNVIDGQDLDARDYAVSYAKIAATGYRASISMDDGINEMIQAFRSMERVPVYANA